ncbi:lipase 3 [Plutella xylostella]|uniref:lipase 3 n=1 Tax=Plutella xylostella TaxID=51655 RepID=UPI002032E42D|nr:lipase 3 [Plutella xylostella]
MKYFWVLTIAVTVTCCLGLPAEKLFGWPDNPFDTEVFGTSPRRDLDFTQLCEYDGYSCETHSVTTEDGYVLSMFRLPAPSNCSGERAPLMFQHGLYLTGDDCLIPGPGKAHCYIYNDACYDVWVPNNRGNRYGRNHIRLNPDRDSAFWDYSLEEHSYKDLPAAIDYVLKETGKEKLVFVGHSQGVTMLMLLCAEKPEYNDKIEIGFGLSVTGWLDHARFPVITLQELLTGLLTSVVDLGVNAEVLPHGGLTNQAAEFLCGITTLTYPICSVFVFAMLGYNEFQITKEVLPVVVGHVPGGTSIKNFNRWGQLRKNGFTKYDHGWLGNIKEYGNLSPPEFDLSAVTMPWVFIASENDYVGDVRDINKLLPKLKNVNMCILGDKTFGHLDFIYGKDIPNYITPKVLSQLEKGSFECT